MASGEFEESFLTVAEVAELLRLNQQTVRNWIDAGSLPAIRVGRRVRIKRSDLDRILESGYRGTPPPASTIQGPSATDFWSGEPVGAVEPGTREGQTPEQHRAPGHEAAPAATDETPPRAGPDDAPDAGSDDTPDAGSDDLSPEAP